MPALLAVALSAAVLAAAGLPADAVAARTVWAVGDGAVREQTDEAVAARIAKEGSFSRLLYLGDVYENGTAWEFANNYHPSFGRFKSKTHPAPGNHEWGSRATGYDPYWGRRGVRRNGSHYYSRDVGRWHLVSLNSQISLARGSDQLRWLRRDLRDYSGTCTIAFMHRPRYSAGGYGNAPHLRAAWNVLTGRAVALLGGHEHNYQRFARRDGLVQFVVGTGGRHTYAVDESDSRLRASVDDRYGALRFRLRKRVARFRFIATGGQRLDAGRLRCRPHR